MANKLEIYTDGAYSSKRNQGGIGIVILVDGKVTDHYSKAYKNTTNNRMEMKAVELALSFIKKEVDNIIIYTDSMYVIGCITLGWKRKKNQIAWKLLDEQLERVKLLCKNIEFVHVKGHNGDKHNEFCDTIAVNASQQEC